MKLVFATQNKNKFKEINALFGNEFSIISLESINCFEEIPETQSTIEGNAFQKADYIYKKYELNCFADDSGLEVEVLNGAPGVYSARYSGEDKNNDSNINKLIQDLNNEKNRTAQFRTVIALILEKKPYTFEGIVKGKITEIKKGNSGFGYDPIFVPDGYTQTFAEMTLQEKNKISHRGQAFRKLQKFLQQYLNA